MASEHFIRQIQTLRPAVAAKALENAINKWLAGRWFTRLTWTWETGPQAPWGGPDGVMAITLDYDETDLPATGHSFQVKAFLQPPGALVGRKAYRALDTEASLWERSTGGEVVDRIELWSDGILIEVWVLHQRPPRQP